MGRLGMEAGAQGGGRAMAQMTAGKTLGMQQEERTARPAAGPPPAGLREEGAGEAEPEGRFPRSPGPCEAGCLGPSAHPCAPSLATPMHSPICFSILPPQGASWRLPSVPSWMPGPGPEAGAAGAWAGWAQGGGVGLQLRLDPSFNKDSQVHSLPCVGCAHTLKSPRTGELWACVGWVVFLVSSQV